MKCTTFAIVFTLAFALPARAQQPQAPGAGAAIANQIGMLVMQNAALNEQVQRLQAVNAGLQKQLADAKAAAAAPKPDEIKGGAPRPKDAEPNTPAGIYDVPDIFAVPNVHALPGGKD